MITREQVADLQPGDIVELRRSTYPDGSYVRGPLYESDGVLYVCDKVVRHENGAPVGYTWSEPHQLTLTVVSRAPRPLYVNHYRTEPVPGDVVRQEDGPEHVRAHTWHYLGDTDNPPRWWRFDDTRIPFDRGARLRLLVDGSTGEATP